MISSLSEGSELRSELLRIYVGTFVSAGLGATSSFALSYFSSLGTLTALPPTVFTATDYLVQQLASYFFFPIIKEAIDEQNLFRVFALNIIQGSIGKIIAFGICATVFGFTAWQCVAVIVTNLALTALIFVGIRIAGGEELARNFFNYISRMDALTNG